MNNKNNPPLISFIDASGTFFPGERYFGVGMLTVNNPGHLTDKLYPVFQRVMAISQTYRNQRIDDLISQNKHQEVISMLKKTKRFELKFDRVTPVKFEHYKEMIRIFLEDGKNRFAVMVIDRQHPSYNPSFFSTTWSAYTSYLASLVVRELTNLSSREMFLVLDELPKPKVIKESLEETIMEKINNQCIKKYSNKDICTVRSAIRIESHSNLLMQLCDVLLGCVMFDYKKSGGILSDKLQKRKEEVVEVLRKTLEQDNLNTPFTAHNPVYFHVWNAEWSK